MIELKQSIAQLLIDNFKGTTSKRASDMAIAIMAFVNADQERKAGYCAPPSTGECSCRKFAADPEICERRTQPEATKPAQDLTLENAPVGTKAPAIMGGAWTRTELGWKWNGGSTFHRPGGDWNGKLIAPAQDLSAAILAMNRAKLLPIWDNDVPHKLHVELDVIFKALAALASPADALVAGDRADAIANAARSVLREALDAAEVHPCDTNNDSARAKQLSPLMQNLYRAIQAQKDGHANHNADPA